MRPSVPKDAPRMRIMITARLAPGQSRTLRGTSFRSCRAFTRSEGCATNRMPRRGASPLPPASRSAGRCAPSPTTPSTSVASPCPPTAAAPCPAATTARCASGTWPRGRRCTRAAATPARSLPWRGAPLSPARGKLRSGWLLLLQGRHQSVRLARSIATRSRTTVLCNDAQGEGRKDLAVPPLSSPACRFSRQSPILWYSRPPTTESALAAASKVSAARTPAEKKRAGVKAITPAPQGEAPIAIGVRPTQGSKRPAIPAANRFRTDERCWRLPEPHQKRHPILPPCARAGEGESTKKCGFLAPCSPAHCLRRRCASCRVCGHPARSDSPLH
jgi:hypothetical protein